MKSISRSFGEFKESAFALVRRGPRSVIWTPQNVRFGNILYYWLAAHVRRERGDDVKVLENSHFGSLAEYFPGLHRSFSITRSEVRTTDKRLVLGAAQGYGADFQEQDLDSFIHMLMSERSGFLDSLVSRYAGGADLTINVRRGDYYSVPRWRGEYSFDVVEYLRVSIERVQAQAPIQSIMVVSDDLEWCRVKLRELERIAPVATPPASASALEQLAMLAAAPRLILANSTFSYWGGYLADYVRARRPAAQSSGTWAPWFHNRTFDSGKANQLAPRWNVIEEIPGGWDG